MIIKRKVDINRLLDNFEEYSKYDGVKFYITINDSRHTGIITLMKYPNDIYTYYRKNESFWDIKEQNLEGEMLYKLIWKYRKSVNEYLRTN